MFPSLSHEEVMTRARPVFSIFLSLLLLKKAALPASGQDTQQLT